MLSHVIRQCFTVKGYQNTGECDAARFGVRDPYGSHVVTIRIKTPPELHSWAYIQPASEDHEKRLHHTQSPLRPPKALPTLSSPKLAHTHFLCSTEGPLIRVICVSHHLVSLRTHWSLADSSLRLASCFCF